MDQSWVAIGYGSTMTNTDMVQWSANGASSSQADLYGTGDSYPNTDPNNAYTTTFTVNPDSSVWFTSTRPLTPPAGDTETYVIQLNTTTQMIAAYLTNTPALGYHGINRFDWQMTLYEDGSSGGGGGGGGDTPRKYFGLEGEAFHGLTMWISWSVLGLLQLASARYLKAQYSWYKTVHAIIGILLCLTIIMSFFVILGAEQWEFMLDELHTIVGNITIWTGVLLTLGGITAESIRRWANMNWKTNIVTSLGKFHGYFGYLVLLLSQVAVNSGLKMFFTDRGDPSKGMTLMIINIVVYVVVLGTLEVIHQLTLRGEDSFLKHQKNMTVQEFEEEVAKGRKLVVLDELVLDVAPFISNHPGGRFVIEHNIGADISKFFFGGYSLEGNLGGQPVAGYKHSNYARKIVNSLICAQLDRRIQVQSTRCNIDASRTSIVNKFTNAFFFKSHNGASVPNFRRFYPGLRMCGKHFTVKSLEGNKPTRHYTICNIMEPNAYNELIRLLKQDKQQDNQASGHV